MARARAGATPGRSASKRNARTSAGVTLKNALGTTKVESKAKAYGRTGSAANQKRMIENEANGTSRKTGYKTGLPSKKKKK